MNITYLEYFDHYIMGPSAATAVMDPDCFLMLCTAISAAKDDEEVEYMTGGGVCDLIENELCISKGETL